MGEIAVQAPDPVMFLGYWNKLRYTEKIKQGWLLTGDLGGRMKMVFSLLPAMMISLPALATELAQQRSKIV